MNTTNKILKIDLLNSLIEKNICVESTDDLVVMILLSARATLYLRNNDLGKFENIEPEIDEILNRYKKKEDNLKLSA